MDFLGGLISPFMLVAGLVSLGLAIFGLNAYRKTRDPAMAFVAGAFSVFTLKSFIVGYALGGGLPHNAIDAVDATGDMVTVGLLLAPIMWPRRPS